MDLLSLPDEMLANVLKFCKFDNLLRLRKTNVQIDKVTIRHGINKPKCSVILAEQGRLMVRFKTAVMEDHPTTRWERQTHTLPLIRSDRFTMVETTLKNVRNVDVMIINRQDVDMAWLELLDSMKQPNRIKVNLTKCNFKVSLDDLKRVLSKFKVVDFYTTTEQLINEERVVTDKAVCFILSFAELIIGTSYSEKRVPGITDKTLKMLQTDLPRTFCISGHGANFTLSEVIKTFKVGIMNLCEPPRYWNFGKVKVNSRDEFDRAFNELNAIEGICITYERSESLCISAWYKQSIFGYGVSIEM